MCVWEFPLWCSRLKIQLVSAEMRVRSPALHHGLRILHCCKWDTGCKLWLGFDSRPGWGRGRNQKKKKKCVCVGVLTPAVYGPFFCYHQSSSIWYYSYWSILSLLDYKHLDGWDSRRIPLTSQMPSTPQAFNKHQRDAWTILRYCSKWSKLWAFLSAKQPFS